MDPMNPETDVQRHEEIYRGIIVRLFRDSVRLASGQEVIREVVRHPGGVVVLPILEDGRVAFVRQFRYPLGRFILELPAGKLDSGKSPLETIRGELQEEAGYRAATITQEFSFYTTPGISDEIIHFFVARGLSPVPTNRQEGEHMTVEIYSAREALEMIDRGEIADAKTILGVWWYWLKSFNVK